MDWSKKHQEQNTLLAKAVNHYKMELRKSKHEVLSLRHQLQLSREENIQLAEKQADLFQSIEQFESRLSDVFSNNSFGYALLSTSFEQIRLRNPRQSIDSNTSMTTASLANSMELVSQRLSLSHTIGRPHASLHEPASTEASVHLEDDVLNTTFIQSAHDLTFEVSPPQSNKRMSSHSFSRNTGLIKKPSRLPVSTNRRRSAEHSIATAICSRQRRSSAKVIDYREQPINRKMRRIN